MCRPGERSGRRRHDGHRRLDEAATRGINTLNFALAKLTASVEIEVAGAPSSIATDPADGSYVEPLSETRSRSPPSTTRTSSWARPNVRVIKLEGGGLVEGKATEGTGTQTKNGATFVSYTAPSREGTVTFVIDAGKGS